MTIATLLLLAAVNPEQAPWMWTAPALGQPAKAWFRREVLADGPATAYVVVAADRRFTLWCNGRRIGTGDATKFHRFSLNGLIERGSNALAIEVEAGAPHAGVLAAGEIRSQGGRAVPFFADAEWRATATPPQGDAWTKPEFANDWPPVRLLGPHAKSPWSALKHLARPEDRFDLAPGVVARKIADAAVTGSLIAMAYGNDNRLLVSQERGPILNLVDRNRDGIYEAATEFSAAVKSCQGLCMVGETLYAVGSGPQGDGVYAFLDRNRDGVADGPPMLVMKPNGGMGEHGPHKVVVGPDGGLYFCVGNHSQVPFTPGANSPVVRWYEGDLLQPRLEDGNGHAAGIKAPGGSIWRFGPNRPWTCEAAGFRNQYDMAFTSAGDLFTFDSDMEWDVAQPWYRPTRVNHCVPGAEFGWRSGMGNWPADYFDSLPATFDVGRGSPTGVEVYEHHLFGADFRGRLLLCDWSMGRLLRGALEPRGASFGGSFDVLASGNPLNVADVKVSPEGAIVMCLGGRGTEGGVWELRPERPAAPPRRPETWLDEVLDQPQPLAGWARDRTAQQRRQPDWTPRLTAAATSDPLPRRRMRALSVLALHGPLPSAALALQVSRDADPAVRAFAVHLLGDMPAAEVAGRLAALLADPAPTVRRRALESCVRSGSRPEANAVRKLLADNDQFVRFAARNLLSRYPGLPPLPADAPARMKLEQALASLTGRQLSGNDALAVAAAEIGSADPGVRFDALRLAQLALQFGALADPALGAKLLERFPSGQPRHDAEAARLLAFLQVPGAAEKLLAALKAATADREQQIHFALCLHYLKAGWTPATRAAFLAWYDGTGKWDGGNSFGKNVENIFGGALNAYPTEELAAEVAPDGTHPHAAAAILRQAPAHALEAMLPAIAKLAQSGRGGDRALAALEALDRSPSPGAQAALRQLFDNDPDVRNLAARAMARQARPENWSRLVAALRGADDVTAQLCFQSLAKLDQVPNAAEDFRAAILAGLRNDGRAANPAAKTLARWTGSAHAAGSNGKKALAHYQNWYRQRFPGAADPTLPAEDRAKAGFTLAQALDILEKNPENLHGDPGRGQAAFAKANCAKCHLFGKEGVNVGPELTTLRKRFTRRETLESILYPSAVVSDQFKAIVLETQEGTTVTGMPVPGGPPDSLALLLADATKLTVKRADIARQQPAKTSIMPEGLLKGLSARDLHDLFAYLESGAAAPAPRP